MKILITHNAYRLAGGEDAVVAAEVALLREHGHEVALYHRHNDELDNMPRTQAALSAIWSRAASADIQRMCAASRPDVVHVHNTFPLMSPSVLWAAHQSNIPVVQTLHNFRLLCPQAMFLRDGRVCEDCLGKLPWRAVTRKCYRGSALQSAVAVGMLATHRALGTYHRRVTRFIALSAFCRDKFIEGGLPAGRFRIKPNFVASEKLPAWSGRTGGIFVGRLSPEKGLDVLMQAVRHIDNTSIRVVGSGPLEQAVRRVFRGDYLGAQPRERVFDLLHEAQFLVAPSISYETFGLALVEAFACGTPVIASRHGAFAELVEDGRTGLLFTPGNARELAEKIGWAQVHPEAMLEMGRAARREYEVKYTPQRNYQMLIEIYEDAIRSENEGRHAT
ncbi:MAG TPA: glycosyltransferase family 4 protein [Burkholderiaceae bacterium]|jgi:glycosyltransferase involved in cell wall biosynthesis|nr:glycosyltransferase family 4 protein [Burkholderiaceae bacterium]